MSDRCRRIICVLSIVVRLRNDEKTRTRLPKYKVMCVF